MWGNRIEPQMGKIKSNLKWGKSIFKMGKRVVAKVASHAIFQYNVLTIDDTHNTWTNMIVKINIPMLLGSSDCQGNRC